MNNIGNEGAKALGKALEKNVILQTLFLIDNKIGIEGKYALSKMVNSGRVIGVPSLYTNPDSDIYDQAFDKIFEDEDLREALSKNRLKGVKQLPKGRAILKEMHSALKRRREERKEKTPEENKIRKLQESSESSQDQKE